MLAVLSLLVSLVQAEPPKLQPRTYSSPSGEWTCHVDPSSVYGAGSSQVVVKRGAAQAWASELPFTFWEACVTDTGHCAGYAFTHGWAQMMARGHVVVAVVDPQGKLLRDERIERTGSRFIHGPVSPNPLGLFAQQALDRFVVRVADEDVNGQNEEWWPYRLSSGEKLEPLRPKEKLDDPKPLRWSMDARPIAGTPLTLVQWYVAQRRSSRDRDLGTRFVLVDADYEPVWTLSLPEDFLLAEEEDTVEALHELRSKSGILAVSPKRFELRHVEIHKRVAYEIRADNDALNGWSVREVARAPYEETRPKPKPFDEVALQRIASIALQSGAPTDAAEAEKISNVFFDGRGRILLEHGRAKALHVFSAAGRREHVLVPEPEVLGDSWFYGGLIVSGPDGSVYASVETHEDRHLVFSAEGECLGPVELGGPQVAFLASGERWAAGWALREGERVRKLAPGGEELARITRRPSGRFFVDIEAIGCRPSGELAVLSEDNDFELDLFDVVGAPQRTIALHGARADWWTVRYGERWIVLSDTSNAALLISLSSGHVSLARVADGAQGTAHAFELSPDGRELWCATQTPPALHRFALPE